MFRFNHDFKKVIRECANSKHGERKRGTWITSGIIEAYSELNRLGYAHSVEAYLNERLVGGIYGISLGKYFSAESMFYLMPNASKLCLLYLINFLKEQSVDWIDCQVINPTTEKFGATEILRTTYMEMLAPALSGATIKFA